MEGAICYNWVDLSGGGAACAVLEWISIVSNGDTPETSFEQDPIETRMLETGVSGTGFWAWVLPHQYLLAESYHPTIL